MIPVCYLLFLYQKNLKKVIKNSNSATFLDLTANLVSKYLPLEVLTILGHEYKLKQGLCSTIDQTAYSQLLSKALVKKACTKFTELLYLMHANQIGWLPIQSKSENNYSMILCDYNTNAILGELILT